MALADLENVTLLADALTRSEKQRLIEHLSRQLETASTLATRSARAPQKAGGIRPSQFTPPAEAAEPQAPGAAPAAPLTRVAGLNAGEVWMSEDSSAELPDEFWFGGP